MSILVVQPFYEGIIFGADRNVTEIVKYSRNSQTSYIVKGQTQRPKVLKWPNNEALIGYVGAASIGGKSTDEWIYDFIGRNIGFNSFKELSRTLKDEVQNQRIIDEGENKAKILIIHIAGFEIKDGIKIPVLFNIRNYHHFDQIIGYSDPRKEFISSEVWWKEKYFENSTAQSIREDLKQKARSYNLIWIHQGRDLAVFNLFDYSLRKSFELLIKNHPKHNFPETLEEWEKYIKMSILTYEAYFRSFYGPSEQYVGGGVDIVSIRWPS